MSTLISQFSGACGLRFRNKETGAMRGVRVNNDLFLPPNGAMGWPTDVTFNVVYRLVLVLCTKFVIVRIFYYKDLLHLFDFFQWKVRIIIYDITQLPPDSDSDSVDSACEFNFDSSSVFLLSFD